MKKVLYLASIALCLSACKPNNDTRTSGDKITVACYYFPNYHCGDPLNTLNKGKEWSEWELVKTARPRFPGHRQPNIPAWGYG
ncbi:MAG: glycoside hydrolase family 99-like domain-containing protein, partial [Tannerella sp.]|nr:glycoside hydrolase family 99-like domain-containing protein [Tannerella sp.]